jgi:hypothetical protein
VGVGSPRKNEQQKGTTLSVGGANVRDNRQLSITNEINTSGNFMIDVIAGCGNSMRKD